MRSSRQTSSPPRGSFQPGSSVSTVRKPRRASSASAVDLPVPDMPVISTLRTRGTVASPPVSERTLLFVGAGRHQRRAIARVKELGARVVAVDRNADAPGLALADVGEVADFLDAEQAVEVGRRHGVDGVMTVASDRAVPIVAAVAEELGLPGIGREVAHLMTNKIAMRHALAEHGVPQPAFAAVRTLREARVAAGRIGFPAVLK